jgi:polyhydroxyalkanoate synthesis regulator protein
LMQTMMNSYLEQSRSLFENLQTQVSQAGSIFPGFPGNRR